MAKNEIILKSRMARCENSGLVKVTPEAENVLRRLQCSTGIPLRQIASELIIQGESFVRIVGPDED